MLASIPIQKKEGRKGDGTDEDITRIWHWVAIFGCLIVGSLFVIAAMMLLRFGNLFAIPVLIASCFFFWIAIDVNSAEQRVKKRRRNERTDCIFYRVGMCMRKDRPKRVECVGGECKDYINKKRYLEGTWLK